MEHRNYFVKPDTDGERLRVLCDRCHKPTCYTVTSYAELISTAPVRCADCTGARVVQVIAIGVGVEALRCACGHLYAARVSGVVQCPGCPRLHNPSSSGAATPASVGEGLRARSEAAAAAGEHCSHLACADVWPACHWAQPGPG